MPTTHTEKSISSLERVVSRFPTRMDTINELYGNSPTFREICADYTEMAIWLKVNCQSENQPPSANCEYARVVLRELEAELEDCIEGRNALVATEHQPGTN